MSARIQNAKSGLTSSREEKQILKELGEEFKQIKKLFREVVRVLKMGPFKADQPLVSRATRISLHFFILPASSIEALPLQ